MNSSPKPLKFAPGVWSALMQDLATRSGGRRESGGFLLSSRADSNKVVRRWLAYDDLAPECLAYDYVRLEPDAFSRLWPWCAQSNVEVLADVHTHPRGPQQSRSDRAHPMVSLAGHIALIVPWFAQRSPKPRDVSFNVYEGSGGWSSFYGAKAAALIVAT